MELSKTAHKVGVNVHHLEWCTKYRYKIFKQEKYKNVCEEILRSIAKRWSVVIRELSVMPEHIHLSVETPKWMSQSKALQLFKGGCSYQLFKVNEKFRLRYPKGHFFSKGGCANSVGYNTISIVDKYVKHQEDLHQMKLVSYGNSTL